MSFRVRSATKEPRRGSSRTKPSARSCLSASLTGPRLIASCLAMRASTSREPIGNSPERIRSRNRLAVLSESLSAGRKGPRLLSLPAPELPAPAVAAPVPPLGPPLTCQLLTADRQTPHNPEHPRSPGTQVRRDDVFAAG